MEMSTQHHVLTTLSLGKEPPVRIGQEDGWATESAWTVCGKDKLHKR